MDNPVDNLVGYYAKRASEYEQIYGRADRVKGVALLKARLAEMFSGRRVLELACGTGFWTPSIAATAAGVDAFDFNEETLAIARSKNIPGAKFGQGDAYAIADLGRRHDGLFAACWWSHIPLERLDDFLRGAVAALAPGALLAFADNLYLEGSSTPISRRDAAGNCYQSRRLKDGSVHEVLKNFPTESDLRAKTLKFGRNFTYEALDSYWLMSFEA
jgi:SAM-dependent methyltransferase